MSEYLPLIVLLLLGASGAAVYLFLRQRKRKAVIALITDGVDVLAHWTYTPAEWQKAVADEFTWASAKGETGELYFSQTAIYIRSDSHEHLISLADQGRVVTYADYRGTDDSPLKLRVRWKVIRQQGTARQEVKYHKEDYRIPVPRAAKAQAQQVAEFFTKRLENNLDAYTDLVSEDEPISLFGKDSF